MMRLAFLFLLFVAVGSSTSLLRKSISRRQTDPENCQAIEGFDCKCSYYRVTCTTDRDLQSELVVLSNEREKYQSVELVIMGERDYHVRDSTFAPIKQLYKPDGDNLEFRVKFEKFTALHLQSPSIFNRVFPDNLPASARKHMALEIYNPLVQPHNNPNLFQDLNVDSLELYLLYPFRGTFQQLFHGANIKSLRLSGGDITSDLSQSFTGNIGRLELAKQAGDLSVQNFPVYPVHEMIINAYYVSNFNSEHPPNYSNLGELRIHTQERIPANAFRQFSNLHTLSITTDQNIDPQALNGLNHLEKLTIKDTKPPLGLLSSIPSLKEFETNVEKLDEQGQCQLIEKLANGQVAIQAIPNGQECTCVSAYLDTASGRYACDAQNCEQSSCATIRNNYDASTRTFKAPPAIRRADGSDALRQREPRVYTAPFQVAAGDRQKLQKAIPQHTQQQQQPSGYENGSQQQQYQPDQSQSGDQQQQQQYQQDQSQSGDQQQYHPQNQVTPAGQTKKSRRTKPRNQVTTPVYDQSQQIGGQSPDGSQQQQQPDHSYHPQHDVSQQEAHQDQAGGDQSGVAGGMQNQRGEGYVNQDRNEIDDNRPANDDDENGAEKEAGANQGTVGGTGAHTDGHGAPTNQSGGANQGNEGTGMDTAAANAIDNATTPAKRGMRWLPIIIIAAAVVGLVIALVIFLLMRKRRTNRGYNPAATTELGGTTTRA